MYVPPDDLGPPALPPGRNAPVSLETTVLRRLVGGRFLRCGYTTGTCAAAAAKAAATMLLLGEPIDRIQLATPDGTEWELTVLDTNIDAASASCAIRKDAGDDPDATDGALIYATVSRQPGGFTIDGGDGIGRVTKAGLDQPVGAAAINSVPRRMIEAAVREVAEDAGYSGGWRVVISCPTGEQIAAKTFNPRLGVIGGISILGTTGIVEPMSNQALVETTAREIAVLAAEGITDLLVVIGNYGESFVRETLGVDPAAAKIGVVKSSNFIGDALNEAALHGFRRVMVVGHIGKLVKVGIGMLNTHSSVGDGRMETLVACALAAGADVEVLRRVLHCASTDAALGVLRAAESGGFRQPIEARGAVACDQSPSRLQAVGIQAQPPGNLLDRTMAVLARRIQATFDRQVPDGVAVEWLCFMRDSDTFCEVARSAGASALIESWRLA